MPLVRISLLRRKPEGFGRKVGGVVYRGQRCPSWRGQFVFGEFNDSKVYAFPTDGAKATGPVKLVGNVPNVCSINEDVQGELYFCDLGGEGEPGHVMTLVPAP